MSSKRKLFKKRNDVMRCDVCKAPETDETRFGLGLFASPSELREFAYNGGGFPKFVRPGLIMECPGHNDAERISAGVVPASIADCLPGVREAMQEWCAAAMARSAA